MALILNLRGPSGSGKSTLARRLRQAHESFYAVMANKRKQPLYYDMVTEDDHRTTLIGHYESPCGGCDTIANVDHIYKLVDERAQYGDVIFEGMIISSEFQRTLDLSKKHDLHVIQLSTSEDECVRSVNLRRAARGVGPLGNEKNVRGKHKSVISTCTRLADNGVEVFAGDREECFEQCKYLLHL